MAEGYVSQGKGAVLVEPSGFLNRNSESCYDFSCERVNDKFARLFLDVLLNDKIVSGAINLD